MIQKLVSFAATSTIIGMVLMMVYSLTVGVSWMLHASDKASLSQMDAAIAIYQTEYDMRTLRLLRW